MKRNTESEEDLNKQLEEFHEKFVEFPVNIQNVVKNSEVVFLNDHYCNELLKSLTESNKNVTNETIIAENEESKVSLDKLKIDYEEDPAVVRARQESHQVVLDEIRKRVDRRKYEKMVSKIACSEEYDKAKTKEK